MDVNRMDDQRKDLRPSRSPAFRRRGKAPEPSAALVALQEQGLELPRRLPSSPASTAGSWQIPPCSLLSTTSKDYEKLEYLQIDRNESVNSQNPRPLMKPTIRRGSTASIETTVSNIIHLYTNISKQSLKSEYEDISPRSPGDADLPLVSRVHEPKVYRDTVAPLLENQFLDYEIPMVPVPSPLSLISIMRNEVPQTAPSFEPSPPISPELGPAYIPTMNTSNSSIQITPDISPLFRPLDIIDAESRKSTKRMINIEIPDVREADAWYDHPLSPLSPPSAVTALGMSHQTRILASSDGLVESEETQLNGKSPSVTTEGSTVPQPYGLNRPKTAHKDLYDPASAQIAQLPAPYSGDQRRSTQAQIDLAERQPKLSVETFTANGETAENGKSLIRSSHLTAFLENDRYNTDNAHEPTSVWSSSPNEPAQDRRQGKKGLAARIKRKFMQKERPMSDKKQNSELAEDVCRGSVLGGGIDIASGEELTLRTSRGSVVPESSTASHHASQTNLMMTFDALRDFRPGPTFSAFHGDKFSPHQGSGSQPPHGELREVVFKNGFFLPSPVSPLTKHQKHSRQTWTTSAEASRDPDDQGQNSKRHTTAASGSAKATRKVSNKIGKQKVKHASSNSVPQQKYKQKIRTSTAEFSPSPSVELTSKSGGSRPSSMQTAYNNALFEASGGAQEKRRTTLGKMFRSAEERRKDKLKESIMIVGGGKLDAVREPQRSIV